MFDNKRFRYIDLTGQRFGRLYVESRGPNAVSTNSRPAQFWCLCDCGTRKLVRSNNLRRNRTKTTSCGCYAREVSSKNRIILNMDPDLAAAKSFIRGYSRGAQKRKIEWTLTDEQAIYLSFSDCTYCGAPPSMKRKLYCRKKSPQSTLLFNGIDRVDNQKGYTLENTVACCSICNQAKHQLSLEQFNSWIDRILAFRASK